jgi:MFS family permease
VAARAASKYPVLVMCAALMLVMVGFANYAAVLPSVLADRGLTPAQGGVAGGVFFLAYAIASPVFAALTDTRDAKRLCLIGCVLASAGGVTFPLVHDGYGALLAGRALSGLGMAGTYMPGLRLLTDAVGPNDRDRAASIYTSTITLGTSGSFAAAALLEMIAGWSAAFLGAAAAAVLAALLIGAAMRIKPPARVKSVGASQVAIRFGQVLRIPRARLVALAAVGNSWEGMAFRTWWIGLLTFSAAQTGNGHWNGLNFALSSAAAGLLAMPLSVWVAARASAAPPLRRYRVLAIASASSLAVGLPLVVMVDGPFPIVFGLTVLYLCAVFADAGAIPPAMLSCTPPEIRGAALAVLSAAANAAAFAGTAACGIALSLTGGVDSASAWRAALFTMMVGAVIATAAFWALRTRS